MNESFENDFEEVTNFANISQAHAYCRLLSPNGFYLYNIHQNRWNLVKN